MKLRKIILTALAAVLALLMSLLSFSAGAEEKKTETLTIECKKLDTSLVGMEWNIFRIGDVDELGNYTLSGSFAGYPVDINVVTTSELVAASETLEAYAYIDDIVPERTGEVDGEGLLVFPNMDYGIYLMSGTPTIIGSKYYVPSPSIIVINDDGESVKYDYNIKAVPKIKVLAASDKIYNFNAAVKKKWTDDEEKTRPSSVEVTLTRDGSVFKTAVLNAANNWTYKWTNLSSRYKWKVVEKNVPKGYTVTTVENEVNVDPVNTFKHDIEFIITNKGSYVPPKETTTTAPQKPLPQTGQLWWPVPVCSASGMLVFAAGWKISSSKRKKNEK